MLNRIIWLWLVPVLAGAQTYTASVRGLVTDASGASVPGASVVLTEADRNVKHATKTDTTGRYVVTALPPGSYEMTVEASGFRKHAQPRFSLEVQQQATLDVQLSVGELATAVEVQGTAPLLNTAAATLGQVIENQFIITAPLQDRNPLSLVMLSAGVVPTESEAGGTASTNFVANGTRNSTAEVVLDGSAISGVEQNSNITEVKYTPSVDVIEEFKIQTNYFSAEFGNTGGAIVNMVSKSGTNDIHGVGYEFHRNAALNANDFFSNREGLDIPDFKRNVFGVTMGGPVVLPKLYNGKNRTFFFADYEGNRDERATTMLTTVPTPLQLAGDFSQTFRSNGRQYVIYNPYDTYEDEEGNILRRPFAGNVIPASMQNPISRKILKYFPEATSDGDPVTHVNNFYKQGVNGGRGDKVDIKIDHNISDRQRLTSRYSVNWNSSNPANLLGNMAANINPGTEHDQNFVLDYTRTQNPTTVISTRASIMRVNSIRDPLSTGFDSTAEDTLGLSPIFQTLGVWQFPNITATGYRSLGAGGWAIIHRGEDVGLLSGAVTKIAGGHTMKTGAEFRVYHENYFQPGFPAGQIAFSRSMTGMDPYGSSSSQGNGIATMLLGWGSGGEMDLDYPTATASKYFGTYFQDDWRVTSKLTLNLGLRYDFDIPRTERFNRLNWFDFDAPSPIAGQVPGLDNLKGVMRFATPDHRSPYDGDYNNIQPRFGIAYALGKKMSLRAGYGIYYSVSRASIKGEVGSAFRSGTSLEFSRDSNVTQYATLQNPFPNGLLQPPGPSKDPMAFVGLGWDAYDPHTVNPQWQQWNFSIQRELPGNAVLEVAYSGSKGTHLAFGTDDVLGNRNKLDPSYWGMGRDALFEQVDNPFYGVITNPLSVLSLPTVERQYLLLPYPGYDSYLGGYTAPPYIGNSIYHSAQFKYEKRFSRGLALLAHYTISKLISDSDSPGTDIDWLGGFTGLQNWKNLRQERSLATFDIPQRLVISFDYQLPIGRDRAWGKNMNRVADAFVGGWEISSILTFSSGYPIVPNLDSADLLSGDQRPNLIGDPRTSGSPSARIEQYFNPEAFSQPDADVYGTAPRTLPNYRTYGIRNGDLTLMKNFRITESKRVQFRMESFNLTNTPTFGRPDEYYGSDTFGQITGYAPGRGPRELQLAIKFYY
ncbi:MAG: carboxypeptidase regulatory-like domain-containing protein [Acidobacteriota bacterium]